MLPHSWIPASQPCPLPIRTGLMAAILHNPPK